MNLMLHGTAIELLMLDEKEILVGMGAFADDIMHKVSQRSKEIEDESSLSILVTDVVLEGTEILM